MVNSSFSKSSSIITSSFSSILSTFRSVCSTFTSSRSRFLLGSFFFFSFFLFFLVQADSVFSIGVTCFGKIFDLERNPRQKKGGRLLHYLLFLTFPLTRIRSTRSRLTLQSASAAQQPFSLSQTRYSSTHRQPQSPTQETANLLIC